MADGTAKCWESSKQDVVVRNDFHTFLLTGFAKVNGGLELLILLLHPTPTTPPKQWDDHAWLWPEGRCHALHHDQEHYLQRGWRNQGDWAALLSTWVQLAPMGHLYRVHDTANPFRQFPSILNTIIYDMVMTCNDLLVCSLQQTALSPANSAPNRSYWELSSPRSGCQGNCGRWHCKMLEVFQARCCGKKRRDWSWTKVANHAGHRFLWVPWMRS